MTELTIEQKRVAALTDAELAELTQFCADDKTGTNTVTSKLVLRLLATICLALETQDAIRDALFPAPVEHTDETGVKSWVSADAYYSLGDAIIDIDRIPVAYCAGKLAGNQEGFFCDHISMTTLKRVERQLGEAASLLKPLG